MWSIPVILISILWAGCLAFTIGHFMPENISGLPYELDTIFVAGSVGLLLWWYLKQIEADVRAEVLSEENKSEG